MEIAGKPMRVKVAHMRLCASRAVYVRAYPRETQEMLFDAHARAFAFFGGVPQRGIYDNMKTAVTTVFIGKERVFNRRFLVMADHYMVEPTACSPAAGWEKGQVENQVQTIRGRFFQPRLRFASLEELNGWLEAECRRWAAMHPHPEQKELTVAAGAGVGAPCAAADAGAVRRLPRDEPRGDRHLPDQLRPQPLLGRGEAVRRAVQVRAYADRIVVRMGDEVVAEHPRFFGRDRTIYDPWHYLPVLATQARRAAQRRAVPGLGAAAGACPAAPQAGQRRRSRPAVRARAGGRAERWPGCGRGRRPRGARCRCRQRRGDPQHPVATARAAPTGLRSSRSRIWR